MLVCRSMNRKRKADSAKESPTPTEDIVTILRVPWSFITATRLTCASAMKRGGATGVAKGLSLFRGALRVTITAAIGVAMSRVKAASTSDLLDGVPEEFVNGCIPKVSSLMLLRCLPWTVCNPFRASNELRFRTRAVTSCPILQRQQRQCLAVKVPLQTSSQGLIDDKLASSTTAADD